MGCLGPRVGWGSPSKKCPLPSRLHPCRIPLVIGTLALAPWDAGTKNPIYFPVNALCPDAPSHSPVHVRPWRPLGHSEPSQFPPPCSHSRCPDLGPWLTQQLQAFLVNDQPAAEQVGVLLVSGEGLMRRREPRRTATLEEGRTARPDCCEGIFRRLSRHGGRLIAYSLVFEDPASLQDPDSDTDSDGPGLGPGPRVGIGGERGGPPLEGPIAELEWDPTGDVGWLGVPRSRRVWTPGFPCEVCGRAEPLSVWPLGPWGPHLSSLRTQDRKQPGPRDVTVQIPLDFGAHKEGTAQPRWTRHTLLFLLLLFLLGAVCLFPPPGGPHCPPPRLRGPLHLVLSYVNGPPPT